MLQTPPSLLRMLRDATRDAHDAVEALPTMARLMSPELTATGYVSALRAIHDFQTGLRRALPPRLVRIGVDWHLDDLPQRALHADLAYFGEQAPGAVTPMTAQGRGWAPVGALYVLEGSALGGRVIGRRVTETLGVSAQAGGAFFCGMAAEAVRKRWQDLTSLLDNVPERHWDSVVAGALACFRHFARCLNQRGAITSVRAHDITGATLSPGLSGQI